MVIRCYICKNRKIYHCTFSSQSQNIIVSPTLKYSLSFFCDSRSNNFMTFINIYHLSSKEPCDTQFYQNKMGIVYSKWLDFFNGFFYITVGQISRSSWRSLLHNCRGCSLLQNFFLHICLHLSFLNIPKRKDCH